MEHKVGTDLAVGGAAVGQSNDVEKVTFLHHWKFEAFDSEGNLKWVEEVKNIVVNAGLDDILDKYWKGSAYTAAHYVGLVDGGTSPAPSYAAGDTMSSHTGWTEQTNYLQSPDVRPTLTLGSVSGQSVDNSASKASFSMAGASPDSISIAGAFITTDSTRGGTSGTLISVANFTGGTKALNNGDTLNVTCTLTAASA